MEVRKFLTRSSAALVAEAQLLSQTRISLVTALESAKIS